MKTGLGVFLGLCVSALPIFAEETAFDFYWEEFVSHSLPPNDPMAELIEKRLSDALFDSSNEEEFRSRLFKIHETLRTEPELESRIRRLDRTFKEAYKAKLQQAKTRKLYFSAGGALVGAMISFPIGKALGQTKYFWISVPASALVGGGAGYLLSHLLLTPSYSYSSVLMDQDSKFLEDELNELLRD